MAKNSLQGNYYARQDEIDHRTEYSTQKTNTMSTYADAQIKKILEFNNANGVDSTRLANTKRELGEAKAIFLNEKNTYEDWEAFWFLASYVGTPYCGNQNYSPEKTVNNGYPMHEHLDCSDLSYSFYLEYYGYDKMDDWTGDQVKRGEEVYSARFTGEKWVPVNNDLNNTELKFGDLVLYDFIERDGVEQHVGIYIGDLDGIPQIIDSSSSDAHYYVQIRNIDCTTTKKTTETVGTDSIVTIRRITP